MLHVSITTEEKFSIIDKYKQQLLNSGYSRSPKREIVISALKGFHRKEKERLKERKPKFRQSKDTISIRNRKNIN